MSRLKFNVAVANSGAPEEDTGSKNRRSSKSQMSRKNFLMIICVVILSSFFVLSGCNDNGDDEISPGPTAPITVLNIDYFNNDTQIDFEEVKISVSGEVLATVPYSDKNFSLNLSNLIPPENSLQNVGYHLDYNAEGLKISKYDAKIGRLDLSALKGNISRRIFLIMDENADGVSIWYSDSDVTVRGSQKSNNGATVYYNVSFEKGWNFRYNTGPNRYDTSRQYGKIRGSFLWN